MPDDVGSSGIYTLHVSKDGMQAAVGSEQPRLITGMACGARAGSRVAAGVGGS